MFNGDVDGFRAQPAAAGGEARAEEEQEKGLLQDARYRQRSHGRWDQESVQEACSAASSWLAVFVSFSLSFCCIIN